MLLKRFTAALLLLLLVPTVLFAQEATEEPQPEVTAEATAEPLVASTETEVTEVSTIGPVTVSHPAGWAVIEGQGGTVVIGNVNLNAATSSADLPPETVIVQLRLFGINRLENMDDDPTAIDILETLTSAGAEEGAAPEVTTVEGENYTFALADVGTGGTESLGISYLVTDATFGLVTASAFQSGQLGQFEETIVNILDTIEFDIEAPLPEDVAEAYADYETGFTDEGFPVIGNPDAPVTVTEISSFDCPACGQFHDEVLPEVLTRVEAGDVRFVYVPVYGTGSIPNGDSAARAALCTDGNFWGYHGALFSWQEFGSFAFQYERLQQGATQFDVSADAFDECFISAETTGVLEAGVSFAQSLENFTGTPTVLVGGNPVPAAAGPINDAIDLVLSSDAPAAEDEESAAEATEETSDE